MMLIEFKAVTLISEKREIFPHFHKKPMTVSDAQS